MKLQPDRAHSKNTASMSRATRSETANRGRSGRWAGRSLTGGLFLVLVTVPVYVFAVRLTRTSGLQDIQWLSPAPMRVDMSPASGELFGDIAAKGLYVLAAAGANIALPTIAAGSVLVVCGLAYYLRRYLDGVYRVGFRNRVAVVAWGLLLGSGVVVTDQALRQIAVEVTSVTLASTTTLFLSLAVLWQAENRVGPLGRIVLIGPATLSAAGLSVIAGMLASPSFNDVVIGVTDAFVAFMLLDVFSVVGLQGLLTAVFELEGLAYFGVWVGLTAVLGSLLGAGLVATDTRLADRA